MEYQIYAHKPWTTLKTGHELNNAIHVKQDDIISTYLSFLLSPRRSSLMSRFSRVRSFSFLSLCTMLLAAGVAAAFCFGCNFKEDTWWDLKPTNVVTERPVRIWVLVMGLWTLHAPQKPDVSIPYHHLLPPRHCYTHQSRRAEAHPLLPVYLYQPVADCHHQNHRIPDSKMEHHNIIT